jgi:hypothetical protein
MIRSEIVADYIRRGWVPFAYGGEFTPPPDWQNSKITKDTLPDVSLADTPVALLLGEPSKLVVVDVDPRNGGKVGRFCKYYGITETRTVKTASGGYHLYFHYAGSLKKTKVEKLGVEGLVGIDLLANGSHVLAPPSVRVGHPEKPDGEYTLYRDCDPAEIPLTLLLDWEVATARTNPTTGEVLEEIPPELYDKVLGIHKRNVELAARAPEGSRDDECIARMGASMRIAVALPDEVLSAEKVRSDYEEGVPYPIKDLDGKIDRAIEWAKERAWTEEAVPAGSTIPDSVPSEYGAEYLEQLNRLRVRDAAQETYKMEKLEREARKIPSGEFLDGTSFLKDRPKTPPWLVDGLVHYEGSTLLAGKYKSGKSTLMLNLIQALTTGRPFLGAFQVPNAMRVAYADMELGRSLAWRWFEEIPGIRPDNLIYMPRVGQGSQLNVRADVTRNKLARRLRSAGVDVLIVDPLSPVMSALGISENDAETVRPLLDAFDILKVEANLKGVILTHHTGHQEANRARGATAFMDWPSSFISVIRQGEEQDSPRVFRAIGRDVHVPTTQLLFDDKTRELRLTTSLFSPTPPAEEYNPF